MNLFMAKNNFDCEVENQCEFVENISALRSLSFFSAMPVDTIKALAYFCKRINYIKGEKVFSQGDMDSRAYFILKGKAVLTFADTNKTDTIGTFGEGDFLGTLALLADTKRLFTLQAVADLTVITLDREKFTDFVVDGKGTARLFLDAVIRRIISWEETALSLPVSDKRSLTEAGVSLI